MPPFTRTATFWIAVITALCSFSLWSGAMGPHAILAVAFIPARIAGVAFPFEAVPAVLTPLTATLAHGGWTHLGFNLLFLLFCGLQVERVLGRGAIVLLYLVSAYAAMAAQYALAPLDTAPVIGASGAISGVIGAWALSFGRAKSITSNLRLNRWINILWLAATWAVLQVLVGWTAGQQGSLVATAAHVGGFVAGLLLQRPLLLWRYRKA